MPLIDQSFYNPPHYLKNGHLQIFINALLRKPEIVEYQRERINTDDGDFLDLDWLRNDSSHLAILCHGLEGDTKSISILGIAGALQKRGWDVLAWNFRSCGGVMNQTPRFYHGGATDDLERVIQHAFLSHPAQTIALVGFSLGGNLILKYLGERVRDPRISRAVTFSVPVDLSASSHRMALSENRIYMRHFLKTMREKILKKRSILPDHLPFDRLPNIKTFHEFDDLFTAPLHGFQNAEDYYHQASSKNYLKEIKIPTLLVNARNDPFLTASCFPTALAKEHTQLFLETPLSGGHCGFLPENRQGECWSESRTLTFLEEEDFEIEKQLTF